MKNPDNSSMQATSNLFHCLFLIIILNIAVSRRVQAEENFDYKVMQYMESDNRIKVFSPTFLYKKEFSPDFSIQIDGIFNSISGATPTGAPPVPVYSTKTITVTTSSPSTPSPSSTPAAPASPTYTPRYDDDKGENDDKKKYRISPGQRKTMPYIAKAGATPAAPSTPSSSSSSSPVSTSSGSSSSGGSSTTTQKVQGPQTGTSIPTAHVTDMRYGFNLSATRKINSHTLSAKLSFSTESDYQSLGVALTDSLDFNNKNTILTFGGAYTHDVVEILGTGASEPKNSEDLIVGLTQFIDSKTVFNCNLSFGLVSGYMSDQYKVVELNNELFSEKRPDNKTKEILYLGLTRYISTLKGSADIGYRFYHDSFDITGQTLSLNWYQELGSHFILRPSFRYYDQSEASFYDVRFSGTPEFFSSDYRVSALNAFSYGLKLIWFPSKRYSFDIGVEHYEQKSKDGKTDNGMYPAANAIVVGGRIWL